MICLCTSTCCVPLDHPNGYCTLLHNIITIVRHQPITLLFYLLYYAAVFLKLTNYTQYYAQLQEQELWSENIPLCCFDDDCSIRVYQWFLQFPVNA